MSARKPVSKFYSAENEDEFLFVNDELQVSCVPDTNQSTNASSHRRTDTSLRVQTARANNDSADFCASPTSASLSSLVEVDPAEYDPEAEVGVQLMGMQDAEINLNHILASSLSALNGMTAQQSESSAVAEQGAASNDDDSESPLANELKTHRQYVATGTAPSNPSSGDVPAPSDISNEQPSPSTPQAKPRELEQFQPTVLVDVAILSHSQTTSPIPCAEGDNKTSGAQDPEYVVSAMKVDMCDVFVDTEAESSPNVRDPSHSVEERTNKLKATSVVQPLVEKFEKCLEHYQQDNLFSASSSLTEIVAELANLKRKHGDDSAALDKLERFERVIEDNTDVMDIRTMMQKVETIAAQAEEKDGWTEISNRKDIVTDIKEDTSATPVQTIRVSGLIESPLFHIIAVMNESELLPTVMPLDLTVKKLRQLSRFRQLVHMQIRMPWPFDNRDVVFVARGVDMLHDGRIVIVGESCKAYGNVSIPAPTAGCCRIETQLFGVVIKPISATQTHVCALAQLDLSVNTLPWGVLNYLTRHLAHIGFELFKEHVSQVMDSSYEQRIVENPDFYNHVYERLRQYFAQHVPKSATARADRAALVTSPASEAVYSPLQSPSSSSEDPRVCSRASGAMTSPSLHESELSCTHSESALASAAAAPPALSPVTESADSTAHPSPVPVSLLGQLFRIPSTTRPPPPPGPPPVRPLPAAATLAINAR